MVALIRRKNSETAGLVRGRIQQPGQIRALRASASRIVPGDRKSVRSMSAVRQSWQARAWNYRDEIGELRYAVGFLGHAARRMMLYPAVYQPNELLPVKIEDSDLKQHQQVADDALDRLGDVGGRGDLLGAQMENFEVTGECFLISRMDDGDGLNREIWEIRSTSEVHESEDGKILLRDLPNQSGVWSSTSDDTYVMQSEDYIARMWYPNPQYRRLADSPCRAAESILEELSILSKDIRAAGVSRLANNGILLMPDTMSVVRAQGGDEGGDLSEDDPFMQEMIEAAMAAIADPGSAAAAVPIIARGPAESIKEIRLLTLTRPEADNANKRLEALRRLATTLDLPTEILSGMADLNHWTAWQVDDSTFRHHIEPLVQVEVDAWTAGYFRRYLIEADVPPEDVARMVVWYDPTELLTKPDRSGDAKDGHTAGVLSDQALREHLGFTDEEAPDDEELVRRAVLGKATLDPGQVKEVIRLMDPRLKPADPPPMLPGAPPPGLNPDQPNPADQPQEGPPPADGPPTNGLAARVAEIKRLRQEQGHPSAMRERIAQIRAERVAQQRELEALLADARQTPDWAFEVSRRLAERDQQLRESLRVACEAAVKRTLERAGAKVVSRARSKDAVAAAACRDIPLWAVPGRLGPTLVASLGLTEDAMLTDDLADLEKTWDRVIGAGMSQALSDATRLVGTDPAAVLAAADLKLRRDRADGWAFLRLVLDQNARAGLTAAALDTGQLVPTSGVRAAIAVAGGFDTPTSQGINPATLLPVDPKEHFGQLGTGTTVKNHLEQNGAEVEHYRWIHGFSIESFPPHAALDGFEFDEWDDGRLQRAGFPGDLHPGDHRGCNCDAILVWVPPPAVVEQVANPPVSLSQAMKQHTELPLDTPDAPRGPEWWAGDEGYGTWEKYAGCERTRLAANDLLGFQHRGWGGELPGDADYTRAERMLDWLASPETGQVRITNRESERAGRWAGYIKTKYASRQVDGKWVDEFTPKSRTLSRQMHIPDTEYDEFVGSLGPDIDLSLASFHGLTDAQAAKQDWGVTRAGKSVIIRLVGNPRVIAGWNDATKEVITGGRFQVLAHGVKGDHYEIVIRQLGVFDSKGDLIP